MNQPEFRLDGRLEADTHFLLDAPLCRIGLMDDARFPWLILVPRVPNVREWPDLGTEHQLQLQAEINAAARALQSVFPHGQKLNIAALGNVVPQLHIHVILRHDGDAAWPAPVWNSGQRQPYGEAEAGRIISLLITSISETFSN
ncbi:HIT family protein [Arenimonas maotaiensis]|uniref:HIT family protein n=1 Tax=Arenimonas maotaiensis TaxID=1446479 RepID=A0A917FIU9_9GAMM|nr:HIT domain-containing protein [Arenimonas maotaiensis]GGF83352.1 HIT family protein [Arenimonas maotaiensis]